MAKSENFWDEISNLQKERQKNKKFRPGVMSLCSLYGNWYENQHSNVLAYLLNPRENHRHRQEYLRLFFKTVGLSKLADNPALEKTKVHREKNRIDISLEHEDFFVIIENKIHAGDQYQQLKRYKECALKRYPESRIYTLYLSLDGHKPSKESTGANDEDIEEAQECDDVQCISYAQHILDWLQLLSFRANELLLRSAIEQYIYTIQELTHQTQAEVDLADRILHLLEVFALNREECFAIENAVLIKNVSDFVGRFAQSFSGLLNDFPEDLKKQIPSEFWQDILMWQKLNLGDMESICAEKWQAWGIFLPLGPIQLRLEITRLGYLYGFRTSHGLACEFEGRPLVGSVYNGERKLPKAFDDMKEEQQVYLSLGYMSDSWGWWMAYKSIDRPNLERADAVAEDLANLYQEYLKWHDAYKDAKK